MPLKHLDILLLTLACAILSPETKAQTPALTLTVHVTQPTCGASSGEINFSATGGTPSYTYTFRGSNTMAQTDFTGLWMAPSPLRPPADWLPFNIP